MFLPLQPTPFTVGSRSPKSAFSSHVLPVRARASERGEKKVGEQIPILTRDSCSCDDHHQNVPVSDALANALFCRSPRLGGPFPKDPSTDTTRKRAGCSSLKPEPGSTAMVVGLRARGEGMGSSWLWSLEEGYKVRSTFRRVSQTGS